MKNKSQESLVDYLSKSKKLIKSELKNKLRIAILSNFTTKGLQEVLDVKSSEGGIRLELYESNYGSYAQDILNKTSGLYQFNPEVAIILLDIKKFLGDTYFFPYDLDNIQRMNEVEAIFSKIVNLINSFEESFDGKIIINNFIIPTYSPLGILENKQEMGLSEMVRKINNRIQKKYRESSRVWILDLENFSSKYGKINLTNQKLYYHADMLFDPDFIPLIGEEIMGYLRPFKAITKKCLVLDLDNTIWGGIIGEDGIKGIELDPSTPNGRSFIEFQKKILALYKRGIILAINSKNNLSDVSDVFRNHPYMILKEENFASIKINWNDKATNMKEIADELNIGLDSLVFFDDDELNREWIRLKLPEIFTPELPKDPSNYLEFIEGLNCFNSMTLTEEDKEKGKMYASQRIRQSLKESLRDVQDFLKELGTSIDLAYANEFNTPRISQLTMKTNQFNLTTKRYTEEQIKNLGSDKNYLVLCANAKDRFGDNGITSVAILKKEKDEWTIDTFLLSCRIIGRDIEKAILKFIIDEAKKNKIDFLKGQYIPTQKNTPAKDFYKENGFKLESFGNNIETWIFDINHSNPPNVKFIKVNLKK